MYSKVITAKSRTNIVLFSELFLITFKLIEIVVVARGGDGGGSQELFSTNSVNYLSLFITKYTFTPYKGVRK